MRPDRLNADFFNSPPVGRRRQAKIIARSSSRKRAGKLKPGTPCPPEHSEGASTAARAVLQWPCRQRISIVEMDFRHHLGPQTPSTSDQQKDRCQWAFSTSSDGIWARHESRESASSRPSAQAASASRSEGRPSQASLVYFRADLSPRAERNGTTAPVQPLASITPAPAARETAPGRWRSP